MEVFQVSHSSLEPALQTTWTLKIRKQMRGSYIFIGMEIERNYTRRLFLLFSLSIYLSEKEAVRDQKS